MRTAFAFDTGFMTAQRSVAYALSAEIESYRPGWTGLTIDGRFSLRGDVYALVAQAPAARLAQNYQGFFGLIYNFTDRSGIAPFIGFQPGLGVAAVHNPGEGAVFFYPALSPLFGVHFFPDAAWHLTFALRYVFGEISSGNTGSVYLSEGRVSLGFGYSW